MPELSFHHSYTDGAAPPSIWKLTDTDDDGVAPLASYGGERIFHVSSSMHGLDGFSNNDPANAALFDALGLREQVERIGMAKWGIEFVSPLSRPLSATATVTLEPVKPS